jgi:hypothetical protein
MLHMTSEGIHNIWYEDTVWQMVGSKFLRSAHSQDPYGKKVVLYFETLLLGKRTINQTEEACKESNPAPKHSGHKCVTTAQVLPS